MDSRTPTPELIAKIRKLRELSRRNDNANEAATAAAMASKLIAEHQIAEAMLESESGEAPDGTEEQAWDPVMRLSYWKGVLLTGLCSLYGCAHCYEKLGRGKGYAPVLFGRSEDIAVVKELYGVLSEEIERLTREASSGRRRSKAWQESYKVGCLRGVVDAMRRARREARKAAPSTAIVLLDARQKSAKRALRDAHPDLEHNSDDERDLDPEAFDDGHASGQMLHDLKIRASHPSLK